LPYRLQRVVLEEMLQLEVISPLDIQIMDTVTNAPTLFDDRLVIRYGVGTPMGTFPSFPLANITNGLLAAYSFMIGTHKSPNDISFDNVPARVVGDDFVTWNKAIGENYPEMLTQLGVETSPAKCLISPFAMEMCSKIMTANHVYSQKNLRLPQDEKKLYPDASARLEYYSGILSYYGKESYFASLFAQNGDYDELMELPRPFGLGWHSDLLSSEMCEYLSSTEEALRFHKKPAFTAAILESVMQRRDYYPLLTPSGGMSLCVTERREYPISELDPGVLARFDSVKFLMNELWSGQYTLEEMTDISQQLKTACESLEKNLETLQQHQEQSRSDYGIDQSEPTQGTERLHKPAPVSAETYSVGVLLKDRFERIESNGRKEESGYEP
jgi:hypothetical protein